jgi:uncharacterized protein YvpB
MKIDLCPNRADFFSQINNEVNPYNACQVTSMVAGLNLVFRNLGPIQKASKYKQPEDCLYHYINEDPDILAFYGRSHPGTNVPAPEWADVLCYAVNRLYGKNVVCYEANLHTGKIIQDLGAGLPVMISLRFPDNKNGAGKPSPISGHYILVVGFDENSFLVNDPYKNHLLQTTDGFKNIYSPEDWANHSKGYGIRYNRV